MEQKDVWLTIDALTDAMLVRGSGVVVRVTTPGGNVALTFVPGAQLERRGPTWTLVPR